MRYLSFSLKDEAFGVPLEQVREVIAFPEISPIPGSPKKLLGIANLRSEVIPIIDLRITLGMVPTLTHDTAIIVCEFDGKSYGVVVDCIHSVVAAEPEEIRPMIGSELDRDTPDYVSNIVYRESKICLVINLRKILKASEDDLKKIKTHDQIKAVS